MKIDLRYMHYDETLLQLLIFIVYKYFVIGMLFEFVFIS